MTRGDTLHLEVLGGISSKFEDFSGQVFEDGRDVDGSYAWLIQRKGTRRDTEHTLSTNAHLILGVVLQETLDTAARELDGY